MVCHTEQRLVNIYWPVWSGEFNYKRSSLGLRTIAEANVITERMCPGRAERYDAGSPNRGEPAKLHKSSKLEPQANFDLAGIQGAGGFAKIW